MAKLKSFANFINMKNVISKSSECEKRESDFLLIVIWHSEEIGNKNFENLKYRIIEPIPWIRPLMNDK